MKQCREETGEQSSNNASLISMTSELVESEARCGVCLRGWRATIFLKTSMSTSTHFKYSPIASTSMSDCNYLFMLDYEYFLAFSDRSDKLSVCEVKRLVD